MAKIPKSSLNAERGVCIFPIVIYTGDPVCFVSRLEPVQPALSSVPGKTQVCTWKMNHLGTFVMGILGPSLHLGPVLGWRRIRNNHINALQESSQ